MSSNQQPENGKNRRFASKAKQILHGALPEFLKHGYTRTSMDKVAKSAGVSKQTLYSYYNDKNGLFTALIEEIAAERFQLVGLQPLAGEPQQVLTELAYRYLDSISDRDNLNFMRLIIAESEQRPDLSRLFLSHVSQPASQSLTTYFQECRQLNFSDPEAIARIFIGALMHHILTEEIFYGKEIMPMAKERLVNNLVALVLGVSG
ncbi:MAG TPA: TetR/AcrR family transcriptional regulator [Xenococcaceae cyanobacterium]